MSVQTRPGDVSQATRASPSFKAQRNQAQSWEGLASLPQPGIRTRPRMGHEIIWDPPQASLRVEKFLELTRVIPFLPLGVAADQAWRPGGSLAPALEGSWAGPQLAPSESGCPIPRPSFSGGLLPGAGRPGIILLAKGLTGVVALAIPEKKAWLLFMSCVEKSL